MTTGKLTQYMPNARNRADGRDLLATVPDGSAAAAFFDPQYRGVLDKLAYGNEGVSRGQGRASLDQMDADTITYFIREIGRCLRPSGHLFLWVDKFHLCEGVGPWLDGTELRMVDMITWDKGRMGMGYRSRRKSEYLVVCQKAPIRAKGCWTNHGIPDVWQEKIAKVHPHSKPPLLQQALIEAVSLPGDVILDPAAGGFSVLDACAACGRGFLGCDIRFGDDPSLNNENT